AGRGNRARGDGGAGWRHLSGRRGAAVRQRPIDDLRGRGVVALEDDAGVDRSVVRILLAAGGAMALLGVAGSRCDRRTGGAGAGRCDLDRRRRARRVVRAGARRDDRRDADGARRQSAAAEAAAHRSRWRPFHRRAETGAAGTLPRARGGAARIRAAGIRRSLDVRRRRRSRVRRSAVERSAAAARRASVRGTLRPRVRCVACRRLVEAVVAAERRAGAPRSVARAVGVRPHRRAAVGRVDSAAPLGAEVSRACGHARPRARSAKRVWHQRAAALSSCDAQSRGATRAGAPARQGNVGSRAKVRNAVIQTSLMLLLSLAATSASAGERYALVITGASGGDQYARKYDTWRVTFVEMLQRKFMYQRDHLLVLAEVGSEGVQKSTRENVVRVLGDLRRRLAKDDQLLVLLIGHGSSLDGPGSEDAKFNLVGPDLSASEWADLLRPIPGRLVFVNTSSASFPFLRRIAGKGRVVLTATDSSAQQFETVFPDFFLKAFDDDSADFDKNGRVSIWEAFTYASGGVAQFFQQKGQLATERPLLDDTGAGVGREAQAPGPDGAIAKITYLEPE